MSANPVPDVSGHVPDMVPATLSRTCTALSRTGQTTLSPCPIGQGTGLVPPSAAQTVSPLAGDQPQTSPAVLHRELVHVAETEGALR